MKFLERDLEEIIYNANRNDLTDRGLVIGGKLFRQLRIGNYGIADLVSFSPPTLINADRNIYDSALITVYELKKDKIGISAFLQAIGYVKGIDRYLKRRGVKFDYEINIALIGSTIDTNSTFSYLCDLIPDNGYDDFLEMYEYNYELDGITFNAKNGFKLIDEGFGTFRNESPF